MEINILQKQFKEQQMQLDVLKQSAYFPVYRNSLRGADGMQQYDAEELILAGNNININMQAIAQLKNLKKLRVKGILSSWVYISVDFQDAVFPKLNELEIIGSNVTGNFESVQQVTLSRGYLQDYIVLPYFDLIKPMITLKTVKIYYIGTRITERICYTKYSGTTSDLCVQNVKDFSKIIEFCINHGINVTEIENCPASICQ